MQNLRIQRVNYNKQVSSHPIFPLPRDSSSRLPRPSCYINHLPLFSVNQEQRINIDTPPLHTHTQPQAHSLLIHNLLLVLLFSPPPAPTLHTSSAAIALAVPQDCYSFGWSTINTLKAQSPTLFPEQSTPPGSLRLPASASPRLTTRSKTKKNGSQMSSLQ